MTVSYASQRQRWKGYGFTLLAVATTIYIWKLQAGADTWWARIAMLGLAVWSVRCLIDYRSCIDAGSRTFRREKLLFGRYLIGTDRVPFNEFTSVALNRREDSEDSTTTIYVCLRRRQGEPMEVCRFEVGTGEHSKDAESTAREIAKLTQVEYEDAA
jgi:hypothetical protein